MLSSLLVTVLPLCAAVAGVAEIPPPDKSTQVHSVETVIESGAKGEFSSTTYPASGSALCGEGCVRHVCDPSSVLTGKTRSALEVRLAQLKESPRFECGSERHGFEFAVVLLEHIDGAEDIAGFSNALSTKWGIGHRLCNNGVLLVIARSDRKSYIATGRGARPVLYDGHAADILYSIRPLLQAGRFDEAVEQVAERVIGEALGREQPPSFYVFDAALMGLPRWACAEPLPFGLAALLVAYAAGSAIRAGSNAHRRARFERKLRRLQSARHALLKREGDSRHAPCPICLDPLPTPPPEFDSQPLERGAELLRCGHVFHEACISRWLRGGQAHQHGCPVCRSEAPRISEDASLQAPPPRPAEASESLRYALERLSNEFVDVPGVQHMRNALQASERHDDWVEMYHDMVGRHEAEEAARTARDASNRLASSSHGAGNEASTGCASGFGGGSCVGGGGAGDSW